MANHKRKSTHRKTKGCGLCDQIKRMGNSEERTKPKYRINRKEISVMT